MANFNTAFRRDFNQDDDGKKEKVLKTDVLENYLELSSEMSMPVLKVDDLLKEENLTEESVKQLSEPSVKLEQSDKSETTEVTEEKEIDTIRILPMQVSSDSSRIIQEPEKVKIIPQLDINAQSMAHQIADRILAETHKFWTSKRIVRSKIREINRLSAYSFVGYMITVSESGSILGDIRKYITMEELKHLVYCLIKQAMDAGMVNITQYRHLRKEYNYINKLCSSHKKRISKKFAESMNKVLEEMFEEMTKVY